MRRTPARRMRKLSASTVQTASTHGRTMASMLKVSVPRRWVMTEKFIPKKPVTKVSGRNTAATIVSQLITWPWRSVLAELRAVMASRVSSRQSFAA